MLCTYKRFRKSLVLKIFRVLLWPQNLGGLLPRSAIPYVSDCFRTDVKPIWNTSTVDSPRVLRYVSNILFLNFDFQLVYLDCRLLVQHDTRFLSESLRRNGNRKNASVMKSSYGLFEVAGGYWHLTSSESSDSPLQFFGTQQSRLRGPTLGHGESVLEGVVMGVVGKGIAFSRI